MEKIFVHFPKYPIKILEEGKRYEGNFVKIDVKNIIPIKDKNGIDCFTLAQYQSEDFQSLIFYASYLLDQCFDNHKKKSSEITNEGHGSFIAGNGFSFNILYPRHKKSIRITPRSLQGRCHCDYDTLEANSEITDFFKDLGININYECGGMA